MHLFPPTEDEVRGLEQIKESLEMIESTSSALGQRQCNLVTAEIFQLISRQPSLQTSRVGIRLKATVKKKKK